MWWCCVWVTQGAHGGSYRGVMAELMGKRDGASKRLAGSMHM
jgi:hypothetical protein